MRFVFTVNGWYLGGFATFCRNLSLGLRGRGHRVTLLVLPEVKLRRPVPEGIFEACVVVPRGIGRLGSHVHRVSQTIARLNPEVLVLNDSPYAMAALPLLHHAMARIPVVHSIAPDEVELALSHAEWWDRLLAVSDCVQSALRARRADAPVSVCPLGVPLPESLQKRSPGQCRKFLEVVSVGRVVVHQKRMDRVPGVARLLAEQGVEYHWTVLGDGEYLPQLRQELARAGLTDRFRFEGAVSPQRVAEVLQAAEVFVMCSDCEGMPLALLEAMARGVVPVVSHLPGSTTCLVTDRQSGYLCEPDQVVEFASAIAELARNRALGFEMGKQAAAQVAQHFSLQAFTERFLTLVAEVRSQAVKRPAPLPTWHWQPGPSAARCLGFWRSLRHQSLGRLKRWLIQRRAATLLRA